MKPVQVKRIVNNMEIICKLMNSVAKRYDCRFQYNSQSGRFQFSGDSAYQKYIVEETLSYFKAV